MPSDPIVESLLLSLASDDPQPAWREFLSRYSGLIYHVVYSFDRDPDRSGDCFLFVCRQLSRDEFRRLRKFSVAGRATFSTWLCAVIRNLCLDWHRQEYGRPRAFTSVAKMSAADQLLFELIFRRGLTAEEARHELCSAGYPVSFAKIEDKIAELRRCMSSRQLWLLSSGNTVVTSLEESTDGVHTPEAVDPAPDPETMAIIRQTRSQISAALAQLSEADRLLVRLRYEEDLTLQQVANLVGLKDAQTADRRLREIVAQLRRIVGVHGFVSGKVKSQSV
jgi:RNA polymerase sigma factor (sigma-70 family)